MKMKKGGKMLIGGILAAVVVCAVVALRMRAGRDTSATVETTAKAPGRIAIVYYSQSKVRNTAMIAKWIQKYIGGEGSPRLHGTRLKPDRAPPARWRDRAPHRG